jgi:predicted membrane metal-binding protein
LCDPSIRIFRRSPFRLLVLGAGCLAIAALAASAVRQFGFTSHAAVLTAALGGALWCGWAAMRIWRDATDALQLDAAGFTVRRGGNERRVLWRDVPSRFRAVRLWFDTVIAWSTDGRDPPRGYFSYQTRAARGQVQSIPGDYHWNPFLLARIMNRARREALAPR